jgi:hypothetical protein
MTAAMAIAELAFFVGLFIYDVFRHPDITPPTNAEAIAQVQDIEHAREERVHPFNGTYTR